MSEERSRNGLWQRVSRALPAPVRAKLDTIAVRRRWLLRGLLGVLVFVFVVVLPGYIATQPGFLQRYSGLQPAYSSWTTSTHAEIACRSCHVSPGLLAQRAYDARMVGEFYASLVLPNRQPRVFGKPTNDACERCHKDIRQASPSGDLKIPHRAHVQVLKLECIRCHSYVVHRVNPEGTHSPRMAGCVQCHDGKKARGDCAACHQWKDAPPNHRSAAWLVEHPNRQAELDCRTCHAWTSHWCSECHSKRPASHARRWRSLHGAVIERHRNCEACHKAEFCVRCHGELPKLGFRADLTYVE